MGTAAPHIHNRKDWLTVPLKRVGERGEDKWEEISYEQAIDEIAVKRAAIVKEHGPGSFAVSTSRWNTQTTNGMDRRFTNLLESPNFISGVSLCAGNTAAVNKMVYGWMPFGDYPNTKCVVLLGFVNVIINEELYDEKFVAEWTVGFEELKERVTTDYPLERAPRSPASPPSSNG
jgi:anaerobic selenocysteine-containing dehydrogenase